MRTTHLNIIAPALGLQEPAALPRSSVEHFGLAARLWMQSPRHHDLPLRALEQLLLPPICLQQFAIVMEASDLGLRPVAYLGWANLSAQAERRYIANPLYGLGADDWNSGDRMWFTDFFAPLGDVLRLHRYLRSRVFAKASGRYFSHRSHERGAQVYTFTGAQVDPAYARQWWAQRPMLANARQA